MKWCNATWSREFELLGDNIMKWKGDFELILENHIDKESVCRNDHVG